MHSFLRAIFKSAAPRAQKELGVAEENLADGGQILLVGDFQATLKRVLNRNRSTAAEQDNATGAGLRKERIGIDGDGDGQIGFRDVVVRDGRKHFLNGFHVLRAAAHDDGGVRKHNQALQNESVNQLLIGGRVVCGD